MHDELSVPLVRNSRRAGSGHLVALPRLLATVLVLCAALGVGWAWRAAASLEEPEAVASIRLLDAGQGGPAITIARPAGPAKPAAADQELAGAESADLPAAAPPSGTRTITIIDGSSGRRQEVAIPVAAETAASGDSQRIARARR